jgi:hypothetical protein
VEKAHGLSGKETGTFAYQLLRLWAWELGTELGSFANFQASVLNWAKTNLSFLLPPEMAW